jgi:hypothetical protein
MADFKRNEDSGEELGIANINAKIKNVKINC